MKIEEYTDLINNMVSKPEEAPVIAQQLTDSIKSDLENLSSLESKINEQSDKIKSLQDTNIKLFLGQQSKVVEHDNSSDEQEIRTPEDVDKFIDQLISKEEHK